MGKVKKVLKVTRHYVKDFGDDTKLVKFDDPDLVKGRFGIRRPFGWYLFSDFAFRLRYAEYDQWSYSSQDEAEETYCLYLLKGPSNEDYK